jgi:hypothetical protein
MPHRQDRDAKPHLGGQVTVERGLTAHGPTSDAQGMPASYGAVEPAAGRRARPAGMMGEKAMAAQYRQGHRGAGELAGAQQVRGEPSLSVWSAKHAIARSAKGLR